MCERHRERETYLDAVSDGKAAVSVEVVAESMRNVQIRNCWDAGELPRPRISDLGVRIRSIIRQFHNVIEAGVFFVPTDVENRELAGMGARDRLKTLDALEFAVERARVGEAVSENDFGGSKMAENVSSEPDFTVRTGPDAAN
jgi:hypothetical protein